MMTGPGPDPFTVADAALDACVRVLREVRAADLDRPTPCTEYTVAAVGEHLVRSMNLLGSVAGAEPAEDEPGDMSGRIARPAARAIAAWRGRGLDGAVAIGSTTYPASRAFAIVAIELLAHGWDIADAVGVTVRVDPEVAEHVLARAREVVTDDRRGRSFAAEVHAAPDATALERLAAFTGRRPTA